jgi:hypothetical protein
VWLGDCFRLDDRADGSEEMILFWEYTLAGKELMYIKRRKNTGGSGCRSKKTDLKMGSER